MTGLLLLAASGLPRPAPNRWELRIPLVLALLAVVVGCWLLMRRGWRRRAGRQAGLPPLPAPPGDLGPVRHGPVGVLVVGTTTTRDWLDRVAAHGLSRRGRGTLSLHDTGLVIARTGEPVLHLPTAALCGARVEGALAGKVVGPGGLLVVRWALGDTELDTGMRADDPAVHPDWVRAVEDLLASRAAA